MRKKKRDFMKPDVKNFILYEDSQIIVCHKPAGIAVQTGRLGQQDMVSLLKNYLAAQATGKRTSAPYLAVIHRLDQPVEGLLVFARTASAAADLNRQLTTSGFGKYYRAVVSGKPEPPEGTLEDHLVRDARTNTSRVCEKDTPGAKPARLSYRVAEVSETASSVTSLVEIRLDTGRHHQIRVQMAHLGCPLVGDYKYGYTDAGQDGSARQALMLCACRLRFSHPSTGKQLTFELPFPRPVS